MPLLLLQAFVEEALESEMTYNRPKKKPQKAPNRCGWGTVDGDKAGRRGFHLMTSPANKSRPTTHIAAYCE